PNVHWLAWAGGDGTIKCSELAGAAPVRRLRGHPAPVTALAFSPDSRDLVSVDKGGVMARWTLPRPGTKFGVRQGAPPSRAAVLAFSADGKRLYGGGVDGEVWCWNPETLEPIGPKPAK